MKKQWLLSIACLAACSAGSASERSNDPDPDAGSGVHDSAPMISEEPVREPSCVRDLAQWRAERYWPVDVLDIGARPYTVMEMRALVHMDATGDASIVLAQSFIATHLNECDGCFPPPEIEAVMHETHAWMRANADADGALPFGTPEGPAAEEARRIAADLDAWLATD